MPRDLSGRALVNMSSLKQSFNIAQGTYGAPCVSINFTLQQTQKKESPYAILIQFWMLDYLSICDLITFQKCFFFFPPKEMLSSSDPSLSRWTEWKWSKIRDSSSKPVYLVIGGRATLGNMAKRCIQPDLKKKLLNSKPQKRQQRISVAVCYNFTF